MPPPTIPDASPTLYSSPRLLTVGIVGSLRRQLPHPPWHLVRRPLVAMSMVAGVMLAATTFSACVSTRPPAQSFHGVQRGYASWYGPKFNGRRTANGEVFDMNALTAAHRTLPFGTWVEVTDLDNGRRVTVRINDRGPFVRRRIIDLSYGAARALHMIGPGTARVALRIVKGPEASPAPVERIAGYAVQLGAFRERSRAEALSAKLRPSYPSVAVTSDGVWNRVQIGPFTSRDEATTLARRLIADGLTALVVAQP